MITPLGKELRYIRLENNELLKNMAEKLNITSAYLSSIEHGKVKVTKKFVKNVINKYSLDNEHKERFVNIFMTDSILNKGGNYFEYYSKITGGVR